MAKPSKADLDAALREHMRRLSAKGGAVGGKKRWAGISPAERKRMMREVVRARWAKPRKRRKA